jgi:hypothetical protein
LKGKEREKFERERERSLKKGFEREREKFEV